MTYDSKCLELARTFMEEERYLDEERMRELSHLLAGKIQETIEDFIRTEARGG